MAGLEKNIWLFWKQGLDKAPTFVKHNVASWIHFNKEWRVHVLSEANLSQYTDLSLILRENINIISPAAFSDVLRIHLLHTFGGVWVDATVICLRPLDSWMDILANDSGFFCFLNRSNDRQLASWFMAAKRNNSLVSALLARLNSYWSQNVFANQKKYRELIPELGLYLNTSRSATQGWFHEIVTKGLQIYPYFWLHYLHNCVLIEDPACSNIWEQMPKLDAGVPSRYLRRDPLLPVEDQDRLFVAQERVRLLKFDRRKIPDALPSGSIIEFIYNDRSYKSTPS